MHPLKNKIIFLFFDWKHQKRTNFVEGGFYMNFSQDILLVMLIGILASATGTDLATNTNILLLLLLTLAGNTNNNFGNCCCQNRLF